MDGVNAGTTFTDSSFAPHTITVSGDTNTSSTQKKFGPTSAYFDNTGDFLTVPASSDWNVYGSDYTVDFWFYATSFADWDGLVACNSSDPYGWNIQLDAAGRLLYMAGDGGTWEFNTYNTGQTALSLNTWYHVAMTKSGTTWNIYVDGTLYQGPYTASAQNTDAVDLSIGRAPVWGARDFNGYIDELRMSKGIVRWSTNFTPPATSYTRRRLLSGSVDISGQPSGTNMKYKIETLNQVAGSKETRIYGTSMAWA